MALEDPSTLLLALRQVAKAHGMAEVARRADVGVKTLFRALSENGNPTLDTVTKVLHAAGLRLSVTPWQVAPWRVDGAGPVRPGRTLNRTQQPARRWPAWQASRFGRYSTSKGLLCADRSAAATRLTALRT